MLCKNLFWSLSILTKLFLSSPFSLEFRFLSCLCDSCSFSSSLLCFFLFFGKLLFHLSLMFHLPLFLQFQFFFILNPFSLFFLIIKTMQLLLLLDNRSCWLRWCLKCIILVCHFLLFSLLSRSSLIVYFSALWSLHLKILMLRRIAFSRWWTWKIWFCSRCLLNWWSKLCWCICILLRLDRLYLGFLWSSASHFNFLIYEII